MPGNSDDALAERSPDAPRPGHRASRRPLRTLRTFGLVVGFLLAVLATVVVFLTDDPQVLRLAVVAAAWAFVLAALAAARRGPIAGNGDGAADAATAAREAELRLTYELELEQEIAARREFELRLEHDLRLETEEAVLVQVAELRREMAQVAELRREMAQVAELRADLTRLHAELTEQLSGEMLVERIMLRTQSIRTGPATVEARTVDGPAGWSSEPPGRATVGPPARPAAPGDGTWRIQEVPARSRLDPVGTDSGRRRTDDPADLAAGRLTAERPAAQRDRPPVPGAAGPARPADPPTAEAGAEQPPAGSERLARILAERATGSSSGGRRRHRYRDDGEVNDVLARVLGRS